jgi:DNA repair exonuclease SbcCD nuclease subunit
VTGDNHLSPRLPRLTPQRREQRRERLCQAFGAAVDYAITHHARIFAHVGDLFDHQTPSNRDRAFVAGELARLRQTGIVCVAIGGNHDTPRMQTEHGGAGPQWVYAALDGLRYFGAHDELRPELLEINGLRIAVAGLTNNPVAPPGSDPLAQVRVDDPKGALAQADVGLLLLHAAIEGLSMPNEGERTVTVASLDALDPRFNVVVAGHIHRYAHQRIGVREVVVSGSTEVMEFGPHGGRPGFVWLDLTREGAQHIQHIHLEAQPRKDITLSTENLWPENRSFGTGVTGTLVGRDAALLEAAQPKPTTTPLETVRQAVDGCTPETITRLRIAGPLTREQYHELPVREILRLGQERTFSLDLDLRDLYLFAPDAGDLAPTTGIGPISLLDELDALVAARRQSANGSADDLEAAARLLRDRISAAEGERGQ